MSKAVVVRKPWPSSVRILTGVAAFAGAALGGPALAAWLTPATAASVTAAVLAAGAIGASLMRVALLRPVRLRVENGRLHGLFKDEPLPLGEGRVVVESWAERVRWLKGEPWRRYFQVKLEVRGLTTMLSSRSLDAVGARTFAEAVSRAGRLPLRWICDGYTEDRQPTDLDAPLVSQLLQLPSPPLAHAAPDDMAAVVEPHFSGGVRLHWPLRRSFVTAAGFLAVAAWLIFSLGTACADPPVTGDVFSVVIGMGGLCFGTALLVVLLRFLFPLEVLAGPTDVAKRVLLFRLLPFPLWRTKTAEIESLYLERTPNARLVLAGDNWFRRLPFGSTAEALHIRGVMIGALSGGKVLAREHAPAPRVTTTAEPPEPPEPTEPHCPKCCEPSLARIGGPLDEHACATCAGRFVSPLGTRRLLEDELGLEKDFLRTLVGFFAGERLTCPGCRSKTSPVRLKGVTADLCTGCGGLWLDAGELPAVSSGRYGDRVEEEARESVREEV